MTAATETAATEVPCRYVTYTQAAARMGKCEDTIRAWVKSGKLKRYRLIGRTVILESELDALIAKADEGTPAVAPVG